MGGQERMGKVFRDTVTSVACGENIVVIKTLPGNAQAIAVLLDSAGWEDCLGTVAGDDTVLVIARQSVEAETVRKRLQSFME